jgi:hypothetical protein
MKKFLIKSFDKNIFLIKKFRFSSINAKGAKYLGKGLKELINLNNLRLHLV